MGRLGESPGVAKHAMRKLVSMLGWPENGPELEWIKLPKSNGPSQPHPVFNPITVLENMAEKHKSIFDSTILGETAERESYWYGLRDSILYKANEI